MYILAGYGEQNSCCFLILDIESNQSGIHNTSIVSPVTSL